jgi:hypothetical protein
MTLVVPLAGAGLAFAGDNGKGDERPETAPGQQNAKNAESPAPGQSGQERGKGSSAKKAGRPAKAPKAPKASKPAKSHAKHAKQPKAANPHAKAGKTTLCHSTGSATNPFVTITVSNNAVKAHARHHDGRDIIPAPAEGCPKGADKAKDAAPAKPDAAKERGNGHAKVTICHATGSETNPFVRITIAEPAVAAHRRHQHGEDIIPAPEAGCPGPAAAAAPARAAEPAPATAPAELRAAAPSVALVAPATATAPGGEASLPGTADVLGEFATGAAPSADVAPATATRESGASPSASLGSLPFTGLDLWLVIAAGLAALVAGFAMFRASRRGTA